MIERPLSDDGHYDERDLHVEHSGHVHTHDVGGGHETVPHGDHVDYVDYVHDGHRHAAHERHWDEH